MKIGIVGAGPAGLTLAHALLTLPGPPVRVSVYDRADVLKPAVGGGLQLSCGAACLQDLGIDVSTVAAPLRSVVSRRATDRRELLRLDIQSALADAGAPTVGDAATDGVFAIMRESLQELIASRLPPSTLCLGRTVASAAAHRGGARLRFSDGSEEDVDLVVGCDGISSVVKSSFFPNEPPPAYSGVKVCLAVAPTGSRPAGAEQEFHQWLGDGAYALSASYGSGAPGGAAQDMLALCYADPDAGGENAGWQSTEALRGACERRLRAAGMPPEVESLCAAATRFYETSVFYRRPSLSWSSRGAEAVLCGDAAHALPPFLGAGANQAILDAYRLASELKQVGGTHRDVRGALGAYQRARWFPTTRLLATSRFLGFVETAAGGGAAARDVFFWSTGQLGVARKIFVDGATVKP